MTDDFKLRTKSHDEVISTAFETLYFNESVQWKTKTWVKYKFVINLFLCPHLGVRANNSAH